MHDYKMTIVFMNIKINTVLQLASSSSLLSCTIYHFDRILVESAVDTQELHILLGVLKNVFYCI